VIHRDLKSPNLLLSERPPNTPGEEGGAARYDDDRSFVVKVADFGLSRDKNLTSEGGTAMMTGCGACRRRISHGRRAFVGAGCRSRVHAPSLTRWPPPSRGCALPATGSVLWMAPEVINGESYNEKIDVYSYHLHDISMRLESWVD
jgi:serine/threonine protein kinase